MSVTVRLFAAARAAADANQTQTAPGTLEEITAALVEQFPGLDAVLPRCSFLLNGVAVHGEPADTAVPDGAELDVLPPFAGG